MNASNNLDSNKIKFLAYVKLNDVSIFDSDLSGDAKEFLQINDKNFFFPRKRNN